jgi:hypothetical protein
VPDGLSLAAASIAWRLHLLVHPRRQHVPLDPHPAPAANVASVDLAVSRACAFARLADCLLLNAELGAASVVEITEWYRDLDFHGRTAPLAAVSEMPAAAEEAREEVERIVSATAPATSAFFVLLHAFVTVLVVYPADFGVDEGVVGVCDFDEFVLSFFIASVFCQLFACYALWRLHARVFVWVVFLAQSPIRLLNFAIASIFVETKKLLNIYVSKTVK